MQLEITRCKNCAIPINMTSCSKYFGRRFAKLTFNLKSYLKAIWEKFENRRFYQNSENLKSDTSGFGNVTPFKTTQNLLKHPIDFFLGWTIVNLLIHVQIYNAFIALSQCF